MSVDTILVNLRRAVSDRRRTEIGGGTFTHTEVQELLDYVGRLQHNNRVLENALWRAGGDDEEAVNSYIESEGGLQ